MRHREVGSILPRRILAAGFVLACVSVGIGIGVAPASAGGPPNNGVNPVQDGDQEVGAGAGRRPGTERSLPIPDEVVRSSGPNNICLDGIAGEWQRWGDEPWHEAWGGTDHIDPPPGVPENAEFWFLHCPQEASLGSPGIERGHWSNIPDQPDPPPTATELVLPAWAYVKGLLEAPELELWPDEPLRSIIYHPTFVAIGNPQPSTLYTAARGGVEVWIAVIPSVHLHPGEPGAPEIECDDDGTTYDLDGARPRAQAVGACAHVYEHQTTGDPWGGDVTIDWDVTWGSNIAGQSGDFNDDVVPSVTGFERIVDEVQSVETDD